MLTFYDNFYTTLNIQKTLNMLKKLKNIQFQFKSFLFRIINFLKALDFVFTVIIV